MKNGYIIEIDSRTFPGYNCYINLQDISKDPDKPAKWGRILDLKWAHVFACETSAEEVLAELLLKESFVAPELNHELATRLCNARIIKIAIQDIK